MPPSTTELTRRAFLGSVAAGAALAATDAAATCPADPLSVCNVTHLYSVPTAQIVAVRNADDIRQALRRWPGRVSVGGGRFSMGGQTALAGGLQLDMRSMQQLVALDPVGKVARVQAGMRWRDLQTLIDPHGLAVRTMQSYANFTVGGSVSVNCHGRYVGHGPIVSSVRALQLVLADGTVLEVSPEQHAELFFAAIGGYGGVGVVTEVELALDDNFAIQRHTERVALADYPAWFKQQVASDPGALLHNADLQAPDFGQPHCVTWRRSDKPLTQPARLRSTQGRYLKEKAAIWAMTELPGGDVLRRQLVDPLQDRPAVVWRNYEASHDVAELEPATRSIATYVLQEYFIPERHFLAFARQMAALLQQSSTGTLNVSIRHAPADRQTLMAWAQEDVFSFVVYYKQRVAGAAQPAVAEWTRSMVGLALAHGGTYYLPYQLHATQQQFDAAYPQATRLRALRQSLGATRFSNALWDRYGV
ncbi:FAD/FMN-containing dehydrogenase [Rhodoferax ferrireducens]|uniref:FAD/FMN-containing dehydrogenase n=1 Tax=Rhodoferax ferrireducens TaxID=192843 RepID=A0ABU2CF13_9BURK|nr:FAD-binding oxidoreductase [Rhodoferax ferrireducens]MDR7379919.1 FAD/FMN-containing dehydrogenase [Rhodoferax ferrireducens]